MDVGLASVDPDLSTLLKPARPRLADQVYESLRRFIVDGKIPPGARLIESDLCAVLNVSRTPLREGLRRLEQDGMIERHAGLGLRVTEVTRDGVEEIFGIRSVLEGYAARLAAERITQDELRAIAAAHDDARAALERDDIQALIIANTRFHDGINAASHSPRCVAMSNGIRDWVMRYRPHALADPAARKASFAQHGEILAALTAADPRVEQLVRDHIVDSGKRMLATASDL
jgi:DNA-binding GntR family transcriptional regulator